MYEEREPPASKKEGILWRKAVHRERMPEYQKALTTFWSGAVVDMHMAIVHKFKIIYNLLKPPLMERGLLHL